ncbi:uncharacterized protein LOC124114603 isoform X2 [Haliotis rufescens]|uniref:uncharacterized protein LOC124114603 isoform X2 n=1 Tax=Haliotis rufescens TaxID=6454 RepID=UPI00201F7DD7|nr:uncharacterized protein LOC124114603 isoform X2 [Haliotis rufescens]
MGSGSSKEKTGRVDTRGGGSKPVAVANVNNNVSIKSTTGHSKSGTNTDTGTTNQSPSKSPVKDSNVEKTTTERSPSKSVKTDKKPVSKLEWNSDSDLDDDDWDDFLGKTTSKPVPKPDSKVSHGEQEQTAHNEMKTQELYPETYAQRHTRQQYTFGQDRLIREKTIYRNPDDWGFDEDKEEVTATKGFDASKFRAANQGKPVREKDIFSTQDEFETPRYLRSSEPEEQQTTVSQKPTPMVLPQYNKEEEDLMAQLMEDDDDFFPHQAMHHSNIMTF